MRKGIPESKCDPADLGFAMITRGGADGNPAWVKSGPGWSISINIPRWQMALSGFMHTHFRPHIDFPAKIDFTSPAGDGSVIVGDYHELLAAVDALKDPIILMAGATPVSRRMIEAI
jgi:hypothetical protein